MKIFSTFCIAIALALCCGQAQSITTEHWNKPVNLDGIHVDSGLTMESSGAVVLTPQTLQGRVGAEHLVDVWGCSGCAFSVGGSLVRKPKHIVHDAQLIRKPVDAYLVPASYIAAAHEIEMESASVDEAELITALGKLGITTYDFNQVDDYLLGKAKEQGANVDWVWKPMRVKDSHVLSDTVWGLRRPESMVRTMVQDLYPHEVPGKVFTEAKAILAEVPDAVFLISDYEVLKPDPFLAVSTPRLLVAGKVFIIDKWNEPNFGTEDAMNAARGKLEAALR